jgi:hypothetical protein
MFLRMMISFHRLLTGLLTNDSILNHACILQTKYFVSGLWNMFYFEFLGVLHGHQIKTAYLKYVWEWMEVKGLLFEEGKMHKMKL